MDGRTDERSGGAIILVIAVCDSTVEFAWLNPLHTQLGNARHYEAVKLPSDILGPVDWH